MRPRERVYFIAGLALVVLGLALTPTAFFILRAVPMTALGLALIILGGVFVSLDLALPRLPLEMGRLLLEVGADNLAALLEELALSGRAVYLPSSVCGGVAQALIPVHSNPGLTEVPRALPRRLIVKYGQRPEDTGVLVTTPGTVALRLLETPTEASPQGLETALSSVLVGGLDVAAGVRVARKEGGLRVEFSHPWRQTRKSRLDQVLGSTLASVAACVAAEAWRCPVTIEAESSTSSKQIVELRLRSDESLQ